MSQELPAPLDNVAVARVLSEIADLLELKGENPFKIRAYRTAADVVGHAAEPVAALDVAALRAWSGIGKDLAVAHSRHRHHRRLPDPARPARGIPADAARRPALARRRAEDGRASLSRPARQEPRRSGGSGQGGPRSRDQGDGREEGGADPSRHRRAPASRRPASAGRHDRSGRRAGRLAPRSVPGRRVRSGRQSQARSGNQRGPRHPRRRRRRHGDVGLHELPACRTRPGTGRDEVEPAAARRLSGGSAAGRSAPEGRGAAVFHRLEAAQHRPSRSRAQPRLAAQRVRALQRRRQSADRRRDRGRHL